MPIFQVHHQADYIGVCPTDHQMDGSGSFNTPVNQWPEKCSHCGLHDVDNPPSPYLLGRRIDRPVELDVADNGNFFVRERVRRVIEAACPGQCVFHPTFDKKTRQPTSWSLAVPVRMVLTGTPRSDVQIPRCKVCGEFKSLHWGSCQDFDYPMTLGSDIAKSLNYALEETREDREERIAIANNRRPNPPTHRWTRLGYYRELYVSIRLELLLKTLGAKGLIRQLVWKNRPTGADKAWVKQQMERLTELGLASPEPASQEASPTRWFKGYLRKNRVEKTKSPDFTAIEARLGKPLPGPYKEFLAKVGSKSFSNVDETEGFDVEIVGLENLDLESYRQGTLNVADEASALVDGVMFATTGHGDVFCFNVSGDGPDYPVFLYEHEMEGFDVFAPSFVACLKRFAEGG